jgi:hypothetical protein
MNENYAMLQKQQIVDELSKPLKYRIKLQEVKAWNFL